MTEDTDAIARRLAAIVESSDDAIVSKNLDGIVLSWNQAAERMFGYTADEMIGTSIRIIIPADRQSEEDTVLASIRAGRRVDHFETVRRARDGRLVPISLTVSPIFDANGVVVGASKIARDVTDRKRAEIQAAQAAQRESFLAEATLTLTSSLDYEKALRTLASLAVPYLADYCAFDVVGQDGTVARVAAAHVLPGKAPLMTDELIAASAMSCVRVPIAVHGRTLGALTMANGESGRQLSDEDRRVAQDLATRSALAIETAQSYQQLQGANRLKDEFLATLSHELRTPLNAVLGYARMLQSGAIAEGKIPQALEVIDRNAGALAQIVEDVLDVSRIVLGKARLKVQPTDVAAVVEDAIATVTPAVDAKGIRLKCSLGHGTAMVSGDHSRLQQVVWNILSNAAKFTPQGGSIHVRVEPEDSRVAIVVSDTGIGFPTSFRPHLFQRFRQAESGTTRPHGGLGLGLAIARHIVEMHGGTIEAESPGEGKGATFRVVLPSIGVPARA